MKDSSQKFSGYLHSYSLAPDGMHFTLGVSSWETLVFETSGCNLIRKFEYDWIAGGGCASFSPDGKKFFYYISGIRIPGESESRYIDTAVFWEINTDKIKKIPAKIAFDPEMLWKENKILAQEHCTFSKFDLSTRKWKRKKFSFSEGSICYDTGIFISGEGTHAVIGTLENNIKILDLNSGKIILDSAPVGKNPRPFFFSEDGKLLYFLSDRRYLKAINVASGQITATHDLELDYVADICFSPDRSGILFVGYSTGIFFIDLHTSQIKEIGSCADQENFAIGLLPGGKSLIVGGESRLQVFDYQP